MFLTLNKKKNLAIVVVALVMVLAVSSILLAAVRREGGNSTTAAAGYVISPVGDVSLVPAHEASGNEFLLVTNGTVSGRFEASGNVSMYILSDAQYNVFPLYTTPEQEACPQLCPPYYVLKDVSAGNIDVHLMPGRYYLVFYNSNPISQADVTVTQSIVTSGAGHKCQSPAC